MRDIVLMITAEILLVEKGINGENLLDSLIANLQNTYSYLAITEIEPPVSYIKTVYLLHQSNLLILAHLK